MRMSEVPAINDELQALWTNSCRDPYPVYDWLRVNDPVHWSETMGTWVVTRHSDVMSGLSDRRLSNDRIAAYMGELPPADQEQFASLGSHLSGWLGFTDGEQHARLRGVLRNLFNPKSAQLLRTRIGEIVDDALDDLDQRGSGDLVTDLAFRLPSVLFYELLGIPLTYRDEFKRYTDDVVSFAGNLGPELVSYAAPAHNAIENLSGYFAKLVAEDKGVDDTIVAALARASRQGLVTEAELVALLVFVFVAAHDTTVSLIANAFVLLDAFPARQSELRAAPSTIAVAIEEILRVEAPIQISPRVALEGLEISGRYIAKGATVVLANGSANRDPREFVNPDELDFARGRNRHTSFGWAAHFCLGAPLARLEAAECITRFLDRFRSYEILEPVVWLPNLSIRCPQRLDVRVTR